jgi:thiamine-monophosphate kinase
MAAPDPPAGQPTVGDLGENALVAGVISRFPLPPPWLRVGPGDDAAVLDLPAPDGVARLVIGTDTLVELRDFHREWSTGHDVGVKLAAQNFADIAAMGARPLALVVSLVAPAALPASFAAELADGLADECARAGAAVAGGDVSDGDGVVLTGTALGVLADGVAAVRRDGARPGDRVALAGVCGPSAAGFALLRADATADLPEALGALLVAHRAPRPGYAAGEAAARGGASAMIDISDGLLRDAARIASAAGVTLSLDRTALPRPAALDAAAALLGRPALATSWLLGGGEDHALLACFPPGRPLPAPFRPVGEVLAAGPAPVLVDGRPPDTPAGWTHWS